MTMADEPRDAALFREAQRRSQEHEQAKKIGPAALEAEAVQVRMMEAETARRKASEATRLGDTDPRSGTLPDGDKKQ
jgi:hypothetical protein